LLWHTHHPSIIHPAKQCASSWSIDRIHPSVMSYQAGYPPPGQQAYGGAPPPPAYVAPPPAYPPTQDGGYQQQQQPETTSRGGDGFWKGCCAAICCCCLLDMCFWGRRLDWRHQLAAHDHDSLHFPSHFRRRSIDHWREAFCGSIQDRHVIYISYIDSTHWLFLSSCKVSTSFSTKCPTNFQLPY